MNRPPVPVPDYPSNSMASKAKSKPPVETTMVQPKKQKKSSIKSMWDEHSDDVKSYILYDILAPAVKDMISNIVSSAVVAIREQIDTMLYGSPRSGGYSYNKSRPSRIDYSSQYRGRNRYPKQETQVDTVSYNARHGMQNEDGWFDDIRPFDTRRKCEDALTKLISMIDEYGEASVGDLYDIAGKSYDFTDRKWGWTDLSHTDVNRVRNGYIIVGLPVPKPLN